MSTKSHGGRVVCRATCSLLTVVKIFQQPPQQQSYELWYEMPHKNHKTVLTFLTPCGKYLFLTDNVFDKMAHKKGDENMNLKIF